MLSDQIRAAFLSYFEAQGHLRVASAPLIPRNDATLLLVGAGMVPLKPFFLGQAEPPARRLTSCQKCFRATDIDEVGDQTHDTFFEMLGNFSFGDYSRREAISFAIQLLTRDLGLELERIHPTVHPTDEVAARLWHELAGIPDERISRQEDNFWQAGPTGPCGVDSEVHYDLGPEFASGPDDAPGKGTRFLEVWNLVFMDSERLEDGRTVALARPGIDTGMGLERIAMVLQGVRSIFDTDLFAPIQADFEARCRPQSQLSAEQRQRHLHILADHARGACMLITDGVLPSNDGLGYLIRRLLRRALVSALQLSLEGGLGASVEAVVGVLGRAYPELAAGASQVRAVIEEEEGRFQATLERGREHFEAAAEAAAGHGGVISGADAFRLHDTYGLPLELTFELARGRGLSVDQKGAESRLEEQRRQARSHRGGAGLGPAQQSLPPSEFVGYEELRVETEVLALLAEAGEVEQAGEGEEVEVVLERSPFYAEAGGQVGDRGELSWPGGQAEVLDTQSGGPGSRLQRCRLLRGGLGRGQMVEAKVDLERRSRCAAHHSATHLLNASLHRLLGGRVVQRGSLVSQDHATFDFGWAEPLGQERLAVLEREINNAIRTDLERRTEVLPLAEARAEGALSLPDELYFERVRVVSFGDFSKELCGGTHVHRTGEIGAVIVSGERSVGSGLRRIELLAGPAAERWWEVERERERSLSRVLKATPAELEARASSLQQRVRELERRLQERAAGDGALAAGVRRESLAGTTLAVLDLPQALERRDLLGRADQLLEQLGEGCALVLAGAQLAIKLSPELIARGLDAGRLAAEVCREGSGGGGDSELGRGGLGPTEHATALGTLRNILGSTLEVG